ncbi:hypothetical protein FHS26_004450 [Rhizobium pisi]|uniref:Uncharacterized protein n=1 Tax=Rhizobium pisi TaxID=574561 RepID=A0A7W5BRG0_9HYPH|nr:MULTISPECIES: hypothetical protein [Rhizobium]MBB3136693.1 hypothetical protein [Rhizobium pisi]MBY5531402.1 hypothetical protein [Rhizobium leguminosarum]
MSDHDHNPILGLYGTPRADIRSRISERAGTMPPLYDHDDPAKIGSSTRLKNHQQTSR